MNPDKCAALIAVAPAVFVGDEKKNAPEGDRGGGALKLPLDRALRFAWFRFLVSQDGPGLNVVRGSVRRQTAAVESGVTYGDLDRETRDAYVRPTKAEGWDVGLLQLFRAGLGTFGGDGARLRREMRKLATTSRERNETPKPGSSGSSSRGRATKPFRALVVVGARDETTPPRLAESLRDALSGAGVQPENLRFELLPTAAHLPMEQTEGGVRETFEALVVEHVKALVE
jgi:pimeloyl-ACP methyl ester carboxylesterase